MSVHLGAYKLPCLLKGEGKKLITHLERPSEEPESFKVKRTEQIWFQPTPLLRELAHQAKNLYNHANYLVRQTFFQTSQWLRYYSLWKAIKDSASYKHLPSQTAQQVLRILDQNWTNFFRAIKQWKVNPQNFHGRPRPPGYKAKNGELLLIFTNQQAKLQNGYLKFPKRVNLTLKTRLQDIQLNQVRLIPQGIGYRCEIVYTKEIQPQHPLDHTRVASIDLGVRNLVTIVNNIGEKPIIVKGGIVKSINQYYNKRRARFRSIADHQKTKTTNRLQRLHLRRNRKIKDHFHKLSRKIIGWCKENNIGIIVIGYNEDWKQEVNLGKQNNQNFVSIPFYQLVNQIAYKAEEVGIRIIPQEEGYTSKCSFLDLEPIQKHSNYMGQRISRGLFRSSTGTIINADVNAAYNILRKAIPNALSPWERADGIEGIGLCPVRLSHEENWGILSTESV